MTDLLERPAKEAKRRGCCGEPQGEGEREGAPRTTYCPDSTSFDITGTLRIMNAAALSFGSATLTPLAGFDVTLVTKVCQEPVRASIPDWPDGEPPDTYCQDGTFTFDYATTGCDGTFSFSVENAMVMVLFPGHVIPDPSFSCIPPPALAPNPYCILDPSRPQDYTGAHWGRGDVGDVGVFINRNFSSDLFGIVNSLGYLGGCTDGAGAGAPCAGSPTGPGDNGYCQDAGAGFFLPDSDNPFSGIAVQANPSGSGLTAAILTGSIALDLVVDTRFRVLCTAYFDTGWCPVPGASVTITDDCGNTETITSGLTGLASTFAHVNLRRIVDVSVSFTGDCESFSPTHDFPVPANGMIYPELDDLSETFWLCDGTIVYDARPPVEAVVLDCTTSPGPGLPGDVLAHRVGHWVANGNSVTRAWHPDFRLTDTFPFDASAEVGEARLAMEPHIERLSVVYRVPGGDEPTPYQIRRRVSHDWGATWLAETTDPDPLFDGVRHAYEVVNYRTHERCDFYQDASEIDDDTSEPTGRGLIQCRIVDQLGAIVGTYPADGLGIGGILADDTSFSAYYEPEPTSWLSVTFASFGERKVFRSYDDGRTWYEWTADAPPTGAEAGDESGDFIIFTEAG